MAASQASAYFNNLTSIVSFYNIFNLIVINISYNNQGFHYLAKIAFQLIWFLNQRVLYFCIFHIFALLFCFGMFFVKKTHLHWRLAIWTVAVTDPGFSVQM